MTTQHTEHAAHAGRPCAIARHRLIRLWLLPLLLWAAVVVAVAQAPGAKLNIWQGTDVRKTVELTPYLAPGQGNTAVVVCPGGSYFWHDMDAEGAAVGQWLRSNGISAFVLHYRTAGFWAYFTHFRYLFRGNRYPDALCDLQQALTVVRSRAGEYGIDSTRVGAMGFSAGGHLVMLAGEQLPSAQRPAFIAPIYPVVTMTEQCVHKRSRRALLGDGRKNNRLLRDSLSLERHVPADCPPVFLVNCKDDPVVDYRNSLLLDSALTAHHIAHQYLQYRTGGHGFGATDHKGTAECRQWKAAFLSWLAALPATTTPPLSPSAKQP